MTDPKVGVLANVLWCKKHSDIAGCNCDETTLLPAMVVTREWRLWMEAEIQNRWDRGYLAGQSAAQDVATDDLAATLAAAVREEREACIRDACGFCDGHMLEYIPQAEGRNKTGTWVHCRRDGGEPALCTASGILSRAAAIRGGTP